MNGYKINPNQELIAIGVTNTLGTIFGAYPATGSFSRSALKSKSGVRTPAAGILTAIVVIVALYGLTPAFFWIPSAGLSAIIIHAVADLVAKPKQVYSFWRVSPLEFIIWAAAVLVTVFSTIENGIYTSICTSLNSQPSSTAKPPQAAGVRASNMYVHSSGLWTKEMAISAANGSLLHSRLMTVFFLRTGVVSAGFLGFVFLSPSSSSSSSINFLALRSSG